MKKIYAFVLGVALSGGLMAQNYSVTFQVDMNNETVSSNGVHVAGDFQSEAGAGGDWMPGATTMTDGNNDGIYDVTVSIPAGKYEYKFINDNDWPGVESVPAVAQFEEGSGNNNRYFWVSSDTTLPAQLFSGAAPDGMKFVKLKVDMRNQLTSSSDPDVMGEFNNYSDHVQLYDPEGDSIYYNYVFWGGTDTMTYKFRNTHDWNDAESVTDTACGGAGGFGNDRFIDATNDIISDANCYGSCGPCVAAPPQDTVMVTFRVDMSYEAVCNAPDSVDITGGGDAFGNWGTNPVIMTDADNDSIWEVTIQLLTNTDYEFKYRNRIGGNAKWESTANRTLNVSSAGALTLDVVCFEQTGACSGPAPYGPADITFAVDLDQEVPGDTIWIIGSFTDPQWQGGAVPLDYSGTGAVFAATVEVCPNNFQFKFVNGDVNTVTNEEFEGDTAGLPCNVSNGIGGYNRSITRTSANDTVIAYFFSSCDTFTHIVVGVEDVATEWSVGVYPNPASDQLMVASNGDDIANVSIMDLRGTSVARVSNVYTARANIDLNSLNLQTGIYFLEITSTSGLVATKKVSVIK